MSRRTPAPAPTISLFPFLAVLLCTMGALLVLLVLFSRSASQAGARVADAAIDDLELALENVRWRRDRLEEVRQKTSDDLSRARMALAGVEENTRALEDDIDRLAREAEALEAAAEAADSGEVAALEERLTSARESLDLARADLATRPPAYAVVPYVGKQGTHRRPIYIECSVDGVYLQPEGIRLAPGDFEGPPGPGNPLASALRAAREQIARAVPNPGDVATQPYPLMLVRPSGVMAYYAAREAIVSWGSEFGYQLIEDDWEIAYPPPDPALAEVERRAVEESRRRLQWLAENHPQRPARPVRQYRAAPTRGGVVENGGPSLMGDQSRYEWTEEQASAAPLGRGARGGSAFAGQAASPVGIAPFGAAPGQPGTGRAGGGPGGVGQPDSAAGLADGEGVTPGRPFLAAAGTADEPAGDAILGAGGGTIGGRGGNGNAGGGVASPGTPGATGNGPPGSPGSGEMNAFGTPGLAGRAPRAPGAGEPGGAEGEGGGTGREGSAGGQARHDGASAVASAPGPQSAPGGGSAPLGSATPSNGASDAGSLGGGNGATGGSGGQVSLPGMLGSRASGGGDSGSGGEAGGSLAERRGANWASLATRDRPVPLTRPIHVECSLAELRILDDTGRRIEKRVPLDGATDAAIDPFVSALHSKVRGWGLAGDRMYWRPQLVLTATLDGESRRDDLERLLADSGIDVRPRVPSEDVHPLPPVQRASYERLLR